MQKNKEYNFFYFTKKEKNGIVMVLVINLILFLLPGFYDLLFPEKPIEGETLELAFSQLKEWSKDSIYGSRYIKNYNWHKEKIPTNINYKIFDPNTISEAEWKILGLEDKTIQTIQKYKSKGGRFYKPEDIKKIWGISPKTCEALVPFIEIKDSEQKNNFSVNKINHDKKIINKKVVDINLADSTCFESLAGIGPALARRILLFRNKLGGFYEVQQLAEVWGLQDSVFRKIKDQCVIKEKIIRTININLAQFEAMKSHPYIGYKIAQSIINYRNQHGSFKSLEDIQKIALINDETYNKLKCYLVVQ